MANWVFMLRDDNNNNLAILDKDFIAETKSDSMNKGILFNSSKFRKENLPTTKYSGKAMKVTRQEDFKIVTTMKVQSGRNLMVGLVSGPLLEQIKIEEEKETVVEKPVDGVVRLSEGISDAI